MIRDGSRSFYLASLLLPEQVRDPARSLYAYCRLADDHVDRATDAAAAVANLRWRLDAIYRGQRPDHPAERAFADVVREHGIPRALPEALIEGFAWDAVGRSYETLSDVIAYGVRVAGTVGAMMALLMETRSPAAIARACDLGVAMQLTNIARDVGEDARMGRLYLPRDWLREEGLSPEAFIAEPSMSPQLCRIIRRLLAEADRLYERSVEGIQMLPAGCRPAIHAARLLYGAIGREVERNGHDPVTRRASVPARRKSLLMASALAAAAASGPARQHPPLPEALGIIAAVTDQPVRSCTSRSLETRAAWLIDLFIRLERQRT